MRFDLPAAGLAVLCAVLLVGPAGADDLGRATYIESCAACHGATAEGDGPLAEILSLPVPDLTGLAERAGGTFPWLRVVHLIDGRSGLRGHGGAMPVFGAIFRGDTAVADAPDGSPVIVSGRVLALVKYLESVQD